MKFDTRVKKITIESFVNGSNGIVISLEDGGSILLALLASFGYISIFNFPTKVLINLTKSAFYFRPNFVWS